MKRWFDRLSVHRKLVVMALMVTTLALTLATAALIAFDVWRYRDTARADTIALAGVIAENTTAAVRFRIDSDARAILGTAGVRPNVSRACLYLTDGTLFAGFVQAAGDRCPDVQPAATTWNVVSGTAPVNLNDRRLGTVYVERRLAEIRPRIAMGALTGIGTLLLASFIAFLLAQRLHRTVSAPIAQLAAAARALDPEAGSTTLPELPHTTDEIGDLARSFTDMVGRINSANVRLTYANEALREREVEREALLSREREANRLKDEFVAAVSHELRTPLNTILGWAQILESSGNPPPEMAANAIAGIARNARAQARLVDDLVDMSRIVAGKLKLQRTQVDLREVVQSAVEVTRIEADQKGHQLVVQASRDPCQVHGDPDRLQQIVWNLLSNAVKFTPQSGVISLTVTQLGNFIELVVTDSGVGISRAFLPYVFDRFRQADGSMTRTHTGLGLGLAIVKELTELHNGSVTVSSDGQGKGSSFTLRFPRLLESEIAAPVTPVPAPDRAILAGVRILAVDDNRDALDVIGTCLASCAAIVRLADGGKAALIEWEREPAEILICDLAMPDVDGLQVLTAIRERDKTSGRITRTVALTAHASAEHRAQVRAAGFDAHVAKPFEVDDLIRELVRLLDRKDEVLNV